MKQRKLWLQVMTAAAVTIVAVSSIVAAVRQGSWGPIVSVGWFPGVAVAVWGTGRRGRCWPRRGSQAR